MRTFEIEPQTVVHDLHPGYLSTTGQNSGPPNAACRLIAVQHHHAHIAACMAEHAHRHPVIGLSLDGTGYGTDGRIWGGEVLDLPSRQFRSASRISNTSRCRAAMPRCENRGAWRSGIACSGISM